MSNIKNPRCWELPDGRWAVDAGMINGHRARTVCRNKETAQKKLQQYLEKLEEVQKRGLTLRASSMEIAAEAFDLLCKNGFAKHLLIDAAHEYVERRHNKEILPDARFEQVVERRIAAFAAGTHNKDYVRNRSGVMRQAARHFAGRDIREIDRVDASKWIFQAPNEASINTRRSAMTAVFSLAVEERLLETNPLLNIKIPVHLKNHATPNFLEMGELAYVLAMARKHDGGSVLVSWLLQAFGGCREDEITKPVQKGAAMSARGLRWEDIILDDDPAKRSISVPYGVAAKNGRARLIPINENLYCWLKALHRRSGPICAPNHVNTEARIRELMRPVLGVWGEKHKNALRHSYATYRLPFIKGESVYTLGKEMGNSRSVISRHYDGMLRATTVEARQNLALPYWEITPENCDALAVDWLKQKGHGPEALEQ